jgi:hypothetical protein
MPSRRTTLPYGLETDSTKRSQTRPGSGSRPLFPDVTIGEGADAASATAVTQPMLAVTEVPEAAEDSPKNEASHRADARKDNAGVYRFLSGSTKSAVAASRASESPRKKKLER